MCSFTLVELLVAITIFLLVAGILSSITNSSSNVWQQGIAHGDRRTAAMAVFDRITRDLRQTAQPTDYSGPRLQMVITGSASTLVSGSYLNPQAIFWQSACATDSGTTGNTGYGYMGNLAVVGYFVQWIGNTPKLCRLLVNPSSAHYAVYSGSTLPSPWISSSLLSTDAPATQALAYQGQLAENVLGLWAQALDQKLAPITRNAAGGSFSPGQFDSTKGYISSSTYTSGTITSGSFMKYLGDPSVVSSQSPALSPSGCGALPASIEVAIITVDSRTALKLTGTEKPSSPTGNLWSDVNTFYNSLPVAIKKGAEIHSTIINLPDAPR